MYGKHAAKFSVLVVCMLLVVSFLASTADISAEVSDDNWVTYFPMHEISPLAGYSTPQGLSPSQVRSAYILPSLGGAGTTIAVVIAYHCPTIRSDLGNFSGRYSLPLPTNSNFLVHQMGTLTNSQWAREAALDVEWAHAIAPNATILLVEAKDSSAPSLYDAIDYATSQEGVVAVSMSWGSPNEFPSEVTRDSHFKDKPGIVFFASSGDNGSLELSYPGSSPYVVSVGASSLTLNPDGSVRSETAWSGSGGGISLYENRPDYQTAFGLTTSKRSVPDVSMVGDPATGVSVYYDGSWYVIGGTSASAPQWAAIHALGLSATNSNLYQKAKVSYSTYFRDITSGSNGDYSATGGYDLVTGLGSPLSFNFGTFIQVSPSSGPAGAPITLSGTGFTAGSSVNISYLNPTTNTWSTVINNYATSTGDFTYTLNAPDLLQNNPAGDNTAASENIVFRVHDNNNSRVYNSTTPYTEYRRGLSHISTTTATGLFGNNTNLASSVFVQNGQTVAVSGKYFTPGTASIMWDDTTSVGTATIDAMGAFTANVVVPVSVAGQHRLTIGDGASFFCLNLTRQPKVIDNYTDSWRTQDFTVNLTADYPVIETYYKINNGPTLTVSTNGYPLISTEGSGNTLEYWSAWNVYGTGTMNLTAVELQGIKLDKNPPQGTITTSATTSTPAITLTIPATDAASGVWQMCFSNDGINWSNWEAYATTKNWSLTSGDGQKNVYAKFVDNAGLTSTASTAITLQSPQPTSTPSPTPAATNTPTPTVPLTSPPSQQPSPSAASTNQPSPSVPELQVGILVLALAATLVVSLALVKKRARAQYESVSI